jgi:hypothetical protein
MMAGGVVALGSWTAGPTWLPAFAYSIPCSILPQSKQFYEMLLSKDEIKHGSTAQASLWATVREILGSLKQDVIWQI